MDKYMSMHIHYAKRDIVIKLTIFQQQTNSFN